MLEETSRKSAQAALCFGSPDLFGSADRIAECHRQGEISLVCVSGAQSAYSRMVDPALTEAQLLSRLLQERGVPARDILVENRATHTGDNVAYGVELIRTRLPDLHTLLLVSMSPRRARLTLRRQYAQISPRLLSTAAVQDYLRLPGLSHFTLGGIYSREFRKLSTYPGLGYLAAERIPAQVRHSGRIVARALPGHVVRSAPEALLGQAASALVSHHVFRQEGTAPS